MVQFNLLPDVKMQYVKTKRMQQLIILVSGLVITGSLVILILMFMVVKVFQTKHLSDVNKDIKKYSNQIKGKTDITKILTIQNQLNSLTGLHNQKPVASRLYGYIGQVTPTQITISGYNIDFDAHTIQITGGADTIISINTFVDTLKFTTYNNGDSTNSAPAFSSVVLSSFSKTDKGAQYTINMNFDSKIFDGNSTPTLVVPPGKITTRSTTEKPQDLFKQSTTGTP